MRRILITLLLLCAFAIPTVATFAQGGEQTYTVQAGDNLFRISLRFGVSQAAIQQANGIANPNLIFIGQALKIPARTGGPSPTLLPGTPQPTAVGPVATSAPTAPTTGSYTVQAGDTLNKIAQRFSTTVQAIIQANGIVNPNLIFVGQVLKVTGAPAGPVNPGNPPAGNPSNPPSASGNPFGSFAAGGQVLDLNPNTQQALRSSKLVWVKIQMQSGDGAGAVRVQSIKSAGFKVLISLVGDKARVTDPNFQNEYAAFAASLAKANADAIEVWNEQNLDREWPNGQISGVTYVQLLSKAYGAIKAANRNTVVISGAPAPTGAAGSAGKTAGFWNDDVYMAEMARAGAGQFADCIGLHYNEGVVSPTRNSGDPRAPYPTRYFDQMLNRGLANFPGKQACFTELGYLSGQGYGPLPAGFEWAGNTTEALQAQWLAEAMSRSRASGRVSMVIVFNVDFPTFGADPVAGFAIIRPGNRCIACTQIAAALP